MGWLNVVRVLEWHERALLDERALLERFVKEAKKSTKIVHRSEFFAGGAPKRRVSAAPVHGPR